MELHTRPPFPAQLCGSLIPHSPVSSPSSALSGVPCLITSFPLSSQALPNSSKFCLISFFSGVQNEVETRYSVCRKGTSWRQRALSFLSLLCLQSLDHFLTQMHSVNICRTSKWNWQRISLLMSWVVQACFVNLSKYISTSS